MLRRRRRLPGPWWLEQRDRICVACEQPHAYGMSIRCAACDGEVCTVCVIHAEDESLCVSCHAAPDPAAPRRRTRPWRRARSGKE